MFFLNVKLWQETMKNLDMSPKTSVSVLKLSFLLFFMFQKFASLSLNLPVIIIEVVPRCPLARKLAVSMLAVATDLP